MIKVLSKALKKTRDFVLYEGSELYRTEEEVYTTHILQIFNGTKPTELNLGEVVKKCCSHGHTCTSCYIGGLEEIFEVDKLRNRYLLLCQYSRRRK